MFFFFYYRMLLQTARRTEIARNPSSWQLNRLIRDVRTVTQYHQDVNLKVQRAIQKTCAASYCAYGACRRKLFYPSGKLHDERRNSIDETRKMEARNSRNSVNEDFCDCPRLLSVYGVIKFI